MAVRQRAHNHQLFVQPRPPAGAGGAVAQQRSGDAAALLQHSTMLSRLNNRASSIGLLEPREPNTRTAIRLSLMSMVPKERQRFIKTVGNSLQRGGWRVCTCCTCKHFIQIVSVRKRLRLTGVFLRIFQHCIVCLTCFSQTLLQATLLVFGWIQSILKRFHISNYKILEKIVQFTCRLKSTILLRLFYRTTPCYCRFRATQLLTTDPNPRRLFLFQVPAHQGYPGTRKLPLLPCTLDQPP